MEYFYFVLITWILSDGILGKECTQRNYNVIGTREIRLFNEKSTFEEAKVKCKIWGRNWHSGESGRLATINNEEDQQCIQTMISTPSNFREEEWRDSNIFTPGYYVGATDAEDEGRWMWQDGSPLSGYTNWAMSEPNTSGKIEGDCLLLMIKNISSSDYTTGKWIDVSCDNRRFYICERELDPSLNWGYENNDHAVPPHRWHELYPKCAAVSQSPISVTINGNTRNCGTKHSFVKGSRASNAQWIVQNTGRFIKITPSSPNSVWTTFLRNNEKFFVDHLILKWGEEGNYGSEHTIGSLRQSGELQVFHRRSQSSGTLHAFAIMLEERKYQANTNWDSLLKSIKRVQVTGLIDNFPAHGSGIIKFLRDSLSRRPSHRAIIRSAVRYQGSMPHPPCTGDVLWSVFTRPVQLSFAQFNILRAATSEDGISPLSNNIRPLQQSSSEVCKVVY